MTKKYLLQLTMLLALVMTTACSKENIADETTTPVTIKINLAELESGYNTRTSYVHPALEGMRVTMIVAQNGVKLFSKTKEKQSLTGSESNISFETNLVTGKSYDITVWADFGDSYYTLNLEEEEVNSAQVPYVSMEASRTGNDNMNDAYWGILENVTIEENKPIGITLKRPLAIVNIKATDYNIVTKKPTKYSTTINAYTSMNLLTGELDKKEDITINGTIGEASDGSLSYDYFFAKEQTENLSDFTVTYSSVDDNPTYSYTFTAIPVKRNNLTNVSGKIFTNSQTDQQ